MVNNAGTGGTESAGVVHDMSEETWDFVMCGASFPLLPSRLEPRFPLPLHPIPTPAHLALPLPLPRSIPPPKRTVTPVLRNKPPPTNKPLPIRPTGKSTPAASSSAASTRARSSCGRTGAPTGMGAGSSIRRACLGWWGCSLAPVRSVPSVSVDWVLCRWDAGVDGRFEARADALRRGAL